MRAVGAAREDISDASDLAGDDEAGGKPVQGPAAAVSRVCGE